MPRTLIVLARAPSAAGKSRLTAGLPPAVAREIREALLLDTLDAARATGEPVTICYTPDDAREEVEALPARLGAAGWQPRLNPQRGGDLGERMQFAFEDAFASGDWPAVLIGSDLPDLPQAVVHSAFALLELGTDVVLGPTADGGYYLIGLAGPRAELFAGIPWSSPDVLACTLVRAREAGLTTARIARWRDVDDPEAARGLLATDTPAGRTRAALAAAGMGARRTRR